MRPLVEHLCPESTVYESNCCYQAFTLIENGRPGSMSDMAIYRQLIREARSTTYDKGLLEGALNVSKPSCVLPTFRIFPNGKVEFSKGEPRPNKQKTLATPLPIQSSLTTSCLRSALLLSVPSRSWRLLKPGVRL